MRVIAKIETKLKPGDIGFAIHTENWISRMFAWFLGVKWSHAFLVVEQNAERTYVLETSDFEVVYGLADWYWAKPDVKMEIWTPKDLTYEERIDVVEEARIETWGEMYGYLQLIATGVRLLLKKVGIKSKNFSSQGVMCMHVVTYGYKASTMPEFNGDPEELDTGDLYRLVSESGKFEKVLEK